MVDTESNVIENQVIKNVTTENFMQEVVEASKVQPVIVDFWAPWCSPCKQLAPIIEKAVLSTQGKVSLVKVNIDENQSIAGQLQIQSIPTVYIFFGGQVVDGFQGNLPESEVVAFVTKALNLSGPGQEVEELITSLNSYLELKDWENAHHISLNILDLDKKNIEGNVGLIKSLVGQKKFKKAKEVFELLDKKLIEDKNIQEAANLIETSEKAFHASSKVNELKEKSIKNPNDLDVSLELSVALFGSGQVKEAYDLLLNSIKQDPNWKEQAARKQLLEFFQTSGINSNEAKVARRALSSILFS